MGATAAAREAAAWMLPVEVLLRQAAAEEAEARAPLTMAVRVAEVTAAECAATSGHGRAGSLVAGRAKVAGLSVRVVLKAG